MQKSQIILNSQKVDQNRNFLSGIYSAELLDARRWFDKLDYSVSAIRSTDRDMTLDKFLSFMDGSYEMRLQIGSPDPNRIRCCAYGSDSDGVEKFAWVEAPFNQYNLEVVGELFSECYGEDTIFYH